MFPSPASADSPAYAVHQPAHRRRTVGSRSPSRRRRRPDRRRIDRSLHRPLPQGSHRRAGRHATPQPGRAAGLSARVGRPPRHHPVHHPGTGQADAGAGAPDQTGRHQDSAGRPLPPLQAKAPDQGADRARSRAGAAGRSVADRSDQDPGGRGRRLRRRREGGRRRQGGAGRRPSHPGRTLWRGRRTGRAAARHHGRKGRRHLQTGRGEEGRGGQILRLFRFLGKLGEDPLAPGLGVVPGSRPGRADHWAGSGGRGRATPPGGTDHRRPHRRSRPGPPRRQMAVGRRALDLEAEDRPACRNRPDGWFARTGGG